MINLLPKAYKAEIRAARTNVILIRYVAIVALAFAFLVLILAGSMFLLTLTKQGSDQLIEVNAAKAAEYKETSDEIDRLANSLSTSRQVFSEQISYSKVLRTIAATMPAGTIIDEMKLDDTSFDGTTTTSLKIYATTNEAAVQLGQRFLSTPGFRNAKIESISDTGGVAGYPVSANLTVTLNRSLGQ